jgi:choline-sulfatase
LPNFRTIMETRDNSCRPCVTGYVLLVLLVLLLCAGSLGGCSRDDRPSMILIIMDTTRFDRLGSTGCAVATTSTLDSLARHGVSFAQTVSAAPVTGPSITSIMTSVLPAEHGVRDNSRFVINDDLVLISEIFQGAGYQTGAIVAAVPLLGRFGYARGFDSYDDRFSDDAYKIFNPQLGSKQDELHGSERRATQVTDRALAWLTDADAGKPVFLLAHYFDPHYPYDAPPAYTARHPNRPYDAEIAYMDAEIGRLLAGARKLMGDDREIHVVAMADHGEGLGQHDEITHGFFVYDATVRVPLIFSGPGASKGLVVREAVRTIDVAPSICSWLGVPVPLSFTGLDLGDALQGQPVPAGCDTAVVETFLTQLHYNWSPLQAVRASGWKYIKAPRPELFDLNQDAVEIQNLYGSNSDGDRGLANWLEDRLTMAAQRSRTIGATVTSVNPEQERRLRSLGYVSGQKNQSLVADFDLLDPKDGNREWNGVQAKRMYLSIAGSLNQQGRFAEALAEVEKAAASSQLEGREAAFHGHLLASLNRHREAVPVFRRALATEKDSRQKFSTRTELVRSLVALEDKAAAAVELGLLEKEPGRPADAASVLALLRSEVDDLP